MTAHRSFVVQLINGYDLLGRTVKLLQSSWSHIWVLLSMKIDTVICDFLYNLSQQSSLRITPLAFRSIKCSLLYQKFSQTGVEVNL